MLPQSIWLSSQPSGSLPVLISLCLLLLWNRDKRGIWTIIHHAKSDRFLKEASVIDLKFKLLIAEVEQLLENQHLEQNQRIHPLASRVAPSLLRVTSLEQWPK